MRWTGDADTDQLLRCRIAGHRDGHVAKRIDTAAIAIFANLTIDQISDLDLSYSPEAGVLARVGPVVERAEPTRAAGTHANDVSTDRRGLAPVPLFVLLLARAAHLPSTCQPLLRETAPLVVRIREALHG